MRFRRTAYPAFFSEALAPIMATEDGLKKLERLIAYSVFSKVLN